jgi:hypothetical protein
MTTDDVAMRTQLQKVAAYRELCRGVRRSGRGNVLFAGLMLFVGYLIYEDAGPRVLPQLILMGVLVTAVLAAGLYKWLSPSAEGVLLDSVVILVFAGYNLVRQFVQFQAGFRIDPVIILLGLLMLSTAVERFAAYRRLRREFAERPSAEHIAWFDDLVREIRAADPQADELALDLPTGPHWKAKLLGTTAFFVGLRDGAVWIAGPDDFEILREKTDRGTGRRRAVLRVHDLPYPEFEVADATWANYAKWRAANPFSTVPDSPPTAVS